MRIRTGFSFRAAVGSVDHVMDRVKTFGWGVAPISDRASTFGYVKWRKAAGKAGLRPIYGVELAVTSESSNAKKPPVDFWSFFAIDDVANVNRLVQTATNQVKYQPMLTYSQAMAATGVIKIAGHRPSLQLMTPADDLYVALAPSLSRGLYNRALEQGFKFIASSDNHYVNPEDKDLYEVLVGFGAGAQTYPQHLLDDEQWASEMSWTLPEDREAALANRQLAFDKCQATIRQGVLLTPEKPVSLRQMCIDGAQRLGIDLTSTTYIQRLDRELKLIDEKQFEDYFFIIADVVQWARKQMICGPARGSSCGSLVCYLLEITTIDPIPYGLIFERFIDTTRSDLPDIDLDFSDTKRHMVVEYMNAKYGQDHVAKLGTVALYKPRSAISEAGAALNIPGWRTDKILDSLIERSSGDSRALQVMEDTFNNTPAGQELLEEFPELRIAERMEGHPRHSSQHAAGIVLTQEPVINYIAIDSRTGATQCDKKDAEELNLLKIDALGLTQLSVFEDALEMAGLPMDHLEKIPLDDQAAFDVINQGRFSGIFQFNGIALQSIAKSIVTRDIEDIISTTALARPGPMATGGTAEWIKRKRGEHEVIYNHLIFKPYLEQTMGIVTYQEQIMEISRNVGGLSWDDVTALRKAMSKSLGKEFFDKYGDPWKKGAIEKGVPPEVAEKTWNDLTSFGAWAFNRSHAVAYGIVSYWCCWLKAHHPFEFAAATLQHETLPDKQIKLLREMKDEGIDYVPVDKEISTDKWQAAIIDNKKVLVGPVQNVKGIGPKTVGQIVSARARGEELPSKAQKLLANPKTNIDSLYPIQDAIEKLLPDPAARGIVTKPTLIKDVQVNGEQQQDVLVIAVLKKIKPRDENELFNVAKRGGQRLSGPTDSINLWIMDDTDVVFAKIGRFDYNAIGKEIVERGKPGKAIYALKGNIPKDFRMLSVKLIKYLGDMDDDRFTTQEKGGQFSKLKAGQQDNDD